MKKRIDWLTALLLIIGLGLMTVSAGMWYHLVSSQVETNSRLNEAIDNSEKKAGSWPTAKQQDELDRARAYNSALDVKHSDMRNDDFNVAKDSEYTSLLDIDGNGLMASVYIPSISTRVPVYHGTADDTLINGAGHMRGTDLPTAEKGTLSVIAGHSGSVQGMYFTRVPSLKIGDLFYVNILGKDFAYKITALPEIDPTDTDALRNLYSQDKTQVVLLTCVPIGINTKRLLVIGELDTQAPPVTAAPKDKIWPWGVIIASLIALLIITLILAIRHFIRRKRTSQITDIQ